jgi:hypothetical protein
VIAANQAWVEELLQQKKRALYIFEITELGVIIASFTSEQVDIPTGGYGVVGYGAGGYGT